MVISDLLKNLSHDLHDFVDLDKAPHLDEEEAELIHISGRGRKCRDGI